MLFSNNLDSLLWGSPVGYSSDSLASCFSVWTTWCLTDSQRRRAISEYIGGYAAYIYSLVQFPNLSVSLHNWATMFLICAVRVAAAWFWLFICLLFG